MFVERNVKVFSQSDVSGYAKKNRANDKNLKNNLKLNQN